MADFLNKIRTLFSKTEVPKSLLLKPTKSRKKVKKKNDPIKEFQTLEQLKKEINRNGYCSIKVKSLFLLFGYRQRGSANVPKILKRLENEGLFISKRVVLDTAWNKNVRVHKFPVEQLGCLFKREKDMEDAFAENEWYKKLDLHINITVNGAEEVSDQQFKPLGTKDRLDFKARDKEGNHVVVELKNKGGDNRLVEQALRYRTHLMNHFGTEKVRCVIITGIRCLHTAKALFALPQHEKSVISWYIYNWDKGKPTEISFEEVTKDFILKHLTQDGSQTRAEVEPSVAV